MPDPLFIEPRFTELYDAQCAWTQRPEYGFYMDLVISAESVLDVGTGTGELLHVARDAGHTGRLSGIDPAEAMLQHARTRQDTSWPTLRSKRSGGVRSIMRFRSWDSRSTC